MNKLSRDFYQRDAVTVARELLGKRLVHMVDGEPLIVEITETEAYAGVNDKACHAYGGRRTARTEVLYQPGGYSYIYLIYGMYYLFNVVVEPKDSPCAALIRGARVVEGHDSVALRRTGKPYNQLTPRQHSALLDGPGKFCSGLALSKQQNSLDLLGEQLYLCEGTGAPFTVETTKRIGIDYAEEDADLPYRFLLRD